MHALRGFHLMWHLFEKPYFYYGIAVLLVALLYPVLVLFKLLTDWKLRSKSQAASLLQPVRLTQVVSDSYR